MNILYLSSMFDDETYRQLFTKEKKPLHAANKYHRLLCKGLAANGAEVKALSVLPTNRANCDKKFVKIKPRSTDSFLQKYLSFFNLPGLRQLSLFFGSFFSVLFAKRGSVLIFDVLMIFPSAGALLAAKLSGKKSVGIVTDLPHFMPVAKKKGMLKFNLFLMRRANGYIFLTRQMNDVANPKNKPFAVLEGHVDSEMALREHSPFAAPKKQALYAGTLAKIYGIKNLCEAFAEGNFSDCELHIYGDGNYADELKELIKQHPNIIYHGNRPNGEVVDHELECHLLVNPRPTAGEFTKYSFPSKTLEYMASGTPVLTARLAGIPEDYEPYLYYFDDTAENGLRDALENILSKSAEELSEKGASAKDFAMKHKSNLSQSKNVMDFIENNIVKK